MRTASRVRERGSISHSEASFTDKIEGQASGKKFFGELACFIWPIKPEWELHIRTGASDRMARWWIDGTHPPNARAVRAILGEILKRLG